MKTLRLWMVMGFFASVGCADDDGVPVNQNKGTIDESALTSGVSVTISGSQGTVQVPFSNPLPDADAGDISEGLQSSVALQVRSNNSGAAVDLAAGTLVDGNPTGPSQFSWTVNEDRDLATLTFFNQTQGGLTLTAGVGYTGTLQVQENDYVERLRSISFQVSVR